jgi:hypothetical protein
MRRRLTMILAGLAALAALALGGAAIANATGVVGDDEAQLSGSDADRAAASALRATGGGSVLESEREGGAIEVEVRKPDGTVVEVQLDSSYRVVDIGGDEESNDDGNDDDQQEDAGEK